MKCTKMIFQCSLLLFLLAPAKKNFAQNNHPDAQYHFVTGNDFVLSKNYYLLQLFNTLPALKQLLDGDSVLSKIALEKEDSLNLALKTCDRNGRCYTGHLVFSEEEINAVSQRLNLLFKPGNALGKMVSEHLIPSGAYILFQDLPPAEILQKAWQQDALGINFAVGVYAEGKKPHYPNIDSISFNTHDLRDSTKWLPGYLSLLYNAAS